MRCALLCLLVCVGCSSSEENAPTRAEMEAVADGRWIANFETAHGWPFYLTVRSTTAVQPKCGTHVLSTKCVSITVLALEADAMLGTERFTMTGHVDAGATAELSHLYLSSAAGDVLACEHSGDRWVGCAFKLHATDYGPFDLRRETILDHEPVTD